jgi:DNA-binding MarR family transcriptional regulator
MSMGDLASALGIDRPNATVLVDDLEAQGLVRRRPHPTDRRAKIVEATRKGKSVARRANEILSTPPAGLNELSPQDLEELRRMLASIRPQK